MNGNLPHLQPGGRRRALFSDFWPLAYGLCFLLLLCSAPAQYVPQVPVETGDAVNRRLTADLKVPTGKTLTVESGGTITLSGSMGGTPTGGTLNLASVTLTVPSSMTLTTPRIANGGHIDDANGNEMLIFTTTASAVNEFTIVNGATGNGAQLKASGGDTNIDFRIVPKGTGAIDGGVARFTGGTLSGTFKSYLDISSRNDFASCDVVFPGGSSGAGGGSSGVGVFRMGQVSVFGTNDIFNQLLPLTGAGYGVVQTFAGAGTVVATSNSTPVYLAPNGAFKAVSWSSGGFSVGTANVGTDPGNGGVLAVSYAINSDTVLARNGAAGIFKVTDGTNIRHFMGGGASVASATALPLPTGSVCHVTGTTTLTSITATGLGNGAQVTLIFDGTCTATDGSNLKLAGNFAAQATDTLTVVYDGSNWYEVARSVNH